MDWNTLWQVLQPYLAGQLRHLLTVLAGYLIARGALAADQQGAFVSIASAMAAWAVAGLWSWGATSGMAAVIAERDRLRKNWNDYTMAKKPPAPSVTKG